MNLKLVLGILACIAAFAINAAWWLGYPELWLRGLYLAGWLSLGWLVGEAQRPEKPQDSNGSP